MIDHIFMFIDPEGPEIEASRVSRRLLFVRRSHDECYKEQVFA